MNIFLPIFMLSNLILSIKIEPFVGFNKPITQSNKVLLPQPVLPEIPMIWFFLIRKETFSKIFFFEF